MFEELSNLSCREFIFMDYEELAGRLLTPDQNSLIKSEMFRIFKKFLKYKEWKYQLHKDMDGTLMALGERACLNLSFLLAIRQVLDIDIPLDLAGYSGHMDGELRKGVNEVFGL